VDAKTWMVAAAAAALLVGCGGGGGDDSRTGTATQTTVSGPPKPKEPLAAAAKRLDRELAAGKCKPLARLMLHSVLRGRNVDPAAPPTKEECAFIRNEAGRELKGFKLTKVQQFGPTGVTEAKGANRRPAEVVGSLWALDVDGSWKLLYDAILRPQIGVPSARDFGSNARRLVHAIATNDCDTFWRLLNVGSRFVRTSNGHKAAFCKSIKETIRRKEGGIAELASDRSANPKELGTTRDIGFFGVELKSGRYMVLALTGRLGGIADAEQTQHDDTSALEIVSARLPAK
jgi:hypothetical protein